MIRLTTIALIILHTWPALAGDYRVTHLERSKVFDGTTLLADMSDPRQAKVVEVDFNGNILWKFRPAGHIRGAILDAAKLENGNILITIRHSGIYEVNPNGKVVWAHRDPGASHDADRLANGNTLYNLGWRKKGEDVVREIDPSGKVVWSWQGLHDYDREPFADIDSEGWMHVNGVSRLKNGNTLVSMRNFNTVAEVGLDGRVVREWTFRGKDKRTGVQTHGKIRGERNHEPEILDNGNMLLALRRPNRFVEFNLETREIVWSWTHPGGGRELRTNREANRLPNGNTLGTAGNKIIEIGPDGTIVWQMLAPAGGKNHRKFHKAIRIGADGKAYGG
ncbi:aryl-sulfate sulfotransferase [Desulfogranum mediterraneum]|uniref:aryl-sulfate sulfotransferase n=1 Tax=Desulfogranum mediterraneum TaxID=160661 RepID=UPI000426D22D|nr:aryl-sulfate sulfotransferase [Desulfogranum mediterraneum]